MEILNKDYQLKLNDTNRDGSSVEYTAVVNTLVNEELKKTFTISVAPDCLDKVKNSKLSFIAKSTNLKGFRPGKAPLDIVWKQNSAEITNEIVNNCINESTQVLVEKLNKDLVTAPKIDLKHFALDKGLEFEISLILMPEFEIPDVTKISLDKLVYEIKDQDVAERASLLMANNKTYIKADAEYVAKKGDKVVIDFEGRIDGVAFDGGAAKGHTIVLGSKTFIDNFEEQLENHKAGDEVLVKVTFPESYHEKKFAGKAAEFTVHINEIHQACDFKDIEELAKSFGMVSAEDLNSRIKEVLEKECADKALVSLKTDLFDKLDATCNFTIPKLMVDEEFSHLWKNVESMIKSKQIDSEKSEEELRAEYLKLAERRVRLGIMLAKMSKEYDVTVEQNDIVEAVRARAMANPASSRAIVEYYTKNPKAIEALKGPILEEKVVSVILAKVQNIDKPIEVKELLAMTAA